MSVPGHFITPDLALSVQLDTRRNLYRFFFFQVFFPHNNYAPFFLKLISFHDHSFEPRVFKKIIQIKSMLDVKSGPHGMAGRVLYNPPLQKQPTKGKRLSKKHS